jgi:DDE superfamily endonuclease
MEDVLDLYAEPEDPQRPRVCFDESPYQIISEVAVVVPTKPGRVERHDYEYRREGTCNLFMFARPHTGWRHVKVTERRTAVDFAYCMRDLVDVHFPDALLIRVVMDQLNTHDLSVLYEVFPPEEARRIARKIEIHYTPKHGSWLDMAEIEFAVLTQQCLDRRFANQEQVMAEIAVWEDERNALAIPTHWQFAAADARQKLKRLYPSSS